MDIPTVTDEQRARFEEEFNELDEQIEAITRFQETDRRESWVLGRAYSEWLAQKARERTRDWIEGLETG